MNALTTDTTPQAPKTRPEPRISKRVRQAIDLLVTGQVRTQKQAAERVRITPEALCRALKRQPERALIEQRVSETIAGAKMKAGAVLEKLMLDGRSEHVRKNVATYFAELAGYVVQKNAAPSVHIHNNLITSGYVYDLQPPASHALPAPTIDGSETGYRAEITSISETTPADRMTAGQKR